MPIFTALSGDEQAKRLRILANNALADWNLAGANLELIKIRENAVYKGTKSSGESYAVRVHRAGYHSDAALNSELQWMHALAAAGIQTPTVIPAADGALFKHAEAEGVPEPRQVDVLAWVDGKPLGTVEAGIEGDDARLSDVFVIIGETTARLHNQAESWQLPDGFVRHAWDVEGLLGEQPVWGRFWENHLLTGGERDLVQRGRDKLRDDLTAFGTTPDRYGLIHADFVPRTCSLPKMAYG